MKRTTVDPSREDTTPIPLQNVINFGPVTLAEFKLIGITTFDQIEALGLEETAALWVESFPERCNALAFLALVTALDGMKWTNATDAQRLQSKRLAQQLRENGAGRRY